MEEERIIFLVLAVLVVCMIPFVPQLTRFRIKILRLLKWHRIAGFIERNFNEVVRVARIVMALIIAVFLIVVFEG